MAGIGTTALWQPEAMIEIMGVAVIPDERLVLPGAAAHSNLVRFLARSSPGCHGNLGAETPTSRPPWLNSGTAGTARTAGTAGRACSLPS